MDKDTSEGLLVGCIPLGAAFGGVLMKVIEKFLSRKHSFYFVNALAIVGGVLVLLQKEWLLVSGRLIQGACVGMYSGLVPIMVKEIAPIEILRTLGAIKNLLIVFGYFFGFLLSYILSFFLEVSQYWYISFSFTLLTISIQQILFFVHYTNETPKYLILKGRIEEAKQLIDKWYLPEYQQKKYEQILKDLEAHN